MVPMHACKRRFQESSTERIHFAAPRLACLDLTSRFLCMRARTAYHDVIEILCRKHGLAAADPHPADRWICNCVARVGRTRVLQHATVQRRLPRFRNSACATLRRAWTRPSSCTGFHFPSKHLLAARLYHSRMPWRCDMSEVLDLTDNSAPAPCATQGEPRWQKLNPR